MSTYNRIISVIGLGYVGLPVACAFARAGFTVVGLDIQASRIDELKQGHDRTKEVNTKDLQSPNLHFTTNPADIARANFHIVTVPTPIDAARQPDLTALKAASCTVGKHIKPGDIIVYESTVYPGCTEEDCLPILEAESGLTAGKDFYIGYSPERINPGDKTHRFETIKKVVSAQTPEALEIVAATYGAVVQAGIHKAASIKVAEAAKVIENSQRDLNIAFMNELSLIFARMGIDTQDVLAAAGTKWNFLPFTPGLVGGHCIGVDPYYLTHKAQRLGYHAEVILAGRRVNDDMGAHIARECVRLLLAQGRTGLPKSQSDLAERANNNQYNRAPRSEGVPAAHRAAEIIEGEVSPHNIKVTILGFTFKENIPDTRNTRVIDIVQALQNYGIDVQVHDPEADAAEAQHEYGISLVNEADLTPADAVIFAVSHTQFLRKGWPWVQKLLRNNSGIVMDVKAALPREGAPDDVVVWRL